MSRRNETAATFQDYLPNWRRSIMAQRSASNLRMPSPNDFNDFKADDPSSQHEPLPLTFDYELF